MEKAQEMGSRFSEPNMQDLKALELIKSGKKDAFDFLYRKYSPFIKIFIFRKVHNQRMVDDMTHDIFLRVYANIDKYKVQCTFNSWLWTIVKNYMKDHYRKDPRVVLSTAKNAFISCEDVDGDVAREKSLVFENTLEGKGLEADLRVRDRERKECVERLLGLVNERERKVIRMYFFEGKSYDEIASELEISMSSMKVLMLRAKEKMRKHVGSFERIEGLLA
jgi:RNA polymerase sigma-70 factor (ECF subfamily)